MLADQEDYPVAGTEGSGQIIGRIWVFSRVAYPIRSSCMVDVQHPVESPYREVDGFDPRWRAYRIFANERIRGCWVPEDVASEEAESEVAEGGRAKLR